MTSTTTSTPDAIHKEILLKAAPARVWQAISNAQQFGTWFGVELHGEFVAGATVRGKVSYQGNEIVIQMQVERVEAERLLAFRWHPYAVDPAMDYAQEPTTLVELAIAAAPGGTRLTVTESGFDRIPEERRAKAFEMNGSGWVQQLENIARHVGA